MRVLADAGSLQLVLILGICSGVVSMTMTKAKISEPVRVWLKTRNKFFYELFSCPYCFGHWSSAFFLLICPVTLTNRQFLLDYFLTWLVVTFISSISSGMIYRIFK